LKVQQFFDKMSEEIELMIATSEGRKPEADRVERIASLKTENARLTGLMGNAGFRMSVA
jgi:hypothetical protein